MNTINHLYYKYNSFYVDINGSLFYVNVDFKVFISSNMGTPSDTKTITVTYLLKKLLKNYRIVSPVEYSRLVWG